MGKAPKGGPPGCFYSKCTVDELSALLRALVLPVSGNKETLVGRLRTHPLSAAYADEGRSPTLSRSTCELVGGREGKQLGDLVSECKALGLKSSGTKYALVHSLITHKASGAPPLPQKAKRAPSTKPGDAGALAARLERKINADTSSWSDYKIKCHERECYGLAHELLTAECDTKGRLAAGDAKLSDVFVALLSALRAGHSSPAGVRGGFAPAPALNSFYNAHEELQPLGQLVASFGRALGAQLAPATRAQLRALAEHFEQHARRHGAEAFVGVASAFVEA